MQGTKRKEAPRAPRDPSFATAAALADHLAHGLKSACETVFDQQAYLDGYVRGSFVALVQDVYGVRVQRRTGTSRGSIEELVEALRAVGADAAVAS